MKTRFLARIICCCIALMLAMAFCGCSNKEEDESGVVVERTFGTPAPTQEQTPPPVQTAEPSPSPSENESSSVTLAEGAESLAYITASDVNVRDINSTSGSVLGQLSAGSIISVVKKDHGNGWSLIKYNDADAYVATQYLTVLTTEKSIPLEDTATANADDVNLRADSTTDAEVIGKLSSGTGVEVIKKDVGHNWSMVLFDSKVAFVASRYLDFASGSAPSASEAPQETETS